MKITTIKKLTDLFVGKLCTILTDTVAKTNFNDTQFGDFFTGFVESIDEDGVIVRHHVTGCKNFYALQHVVGILEEQVITEDDPRYNKAVTELKQIKEKRAAQPIVPASPFVDPAMMAALSKQAADKAKMLQKSP